MRFIQTLRKPWNHISRMKRNSEQTLRVMARKPNSSKLRLFIWSLLALAPIFLLAATGLKAQERSIDCDNRFVTLVNPVRGRDRWSDKTVTPIVNQYDLVKKEGFAATWLLQYDALVDSEIAQVAKSFDQNQEIGLFLEVSPGLAQDARVIYPTQVAWANPRAIFLSGYVQSERRKLIDTLFLKFKKTFGYFPKSIGAWWIDSYSLNYMRQKYAISAAMIVADQKITDNYGVWGQWWGASYYPSVANILTPANGNSGAGVVVIQWAQRDLSLSYGEGPQYSNYSLQANDYLSLGKGTNYFNDLANKYLDCRNPIAQVTVGLETGIEGATFLPEYERQLTTLKKIPRLESLTMGDFAKEFGSLGGQNPEKLTLKDENSEWILTPSSRANEKLGDKIIYEPEVSFFDYFVPDDSNFLDRRLPNRGLRTSQGGWQPLFIPVFLLAAALWVWQKRYKEFMVVSFFILGAFGLLLRSKAQFGWLVYYGPKVANLGVVQALVVGGTFILFWVLFSFLRKRTKNLYLFYWLLPLSFGIDALISAFRYTDISGDRFFGIALDALRFVGVKASSDFGLELVNQDFSSTIAASLLKFEFAKIWNNNLLSLVVYPSLHLLVAGILFLTLTKTRKGLRNIIILILIALFVGHLIATFGADPRVVIMDL